MGFFDFFKGPDIDRGAKDFQETPGAVLLDVRTAQEYREGHIPSGKNVPLQELDRVTAMVPEKDAPLFVYCHSGARSSQAVRLLARMGYTNIKNIGGIAAYTGKVER